MDAALPGPQGLQVSLADPAVPGNQEFLDSPATPGSLPISRANLSLLRLVLHVLPGHRVNQDLKDHLEMLDTLEIPEKEV